MKRIKIIGPTKKEWQGLRLLLLFSIITIFVSQTISILFVLQYNHTLATPDDLRNLANYSRQILNYRVTHEAVPLSATLLIGYGDCSDRSQFISLTLTLHNIKNEIEHLMIGEDGHARNRVWLDDVCYIIDSSFVINDEPLVEFCNFTYPE